MLYDPIPDPITAGWTSEGEEPYLVLTQSLLISDDSVAGFRRFFVQDEAAFAGELQLSPSVLLSSGYTVEGDRGTGVHVVIDDGRNEIRAVVLAGGDNVRVVLKTAGGYTNGFWFPSVQATLQLKRLADGSAVLSANGQTPEIISSVDLPGSPWGQRRVQSAHGEGGKRRRAGQRREPQGEPLGAGPVATAVRAERPRLAPWTAPTMWCSINPRRTRLQTLRPMVTREKWPRTLENP